MGRPQRKQFRRALQNVEIIPTDPAPPPSPEVTTPAPKPRPTMDTPTVSREQQSQVATRSTGPDPASVIQASGESEMAQTSQQYRRRRARGIRTSSQGVTGGARVERKTLLGQ
jgi:hypothetical protein